MPSESSELALPEGAQPRSARADPVPAHLPKMAEEDGVRTRAMRGAAASPPSETESVQTRGMRKSPLLFDPSNVAEPDGVRTRGMREGPVSSDTTAVAGTTGKSHLLQRLPHAAKVQALEEGWGLCKVEAWLQRKTRPNYFLYYFDSAGVCLCLGLFHVVCRRGWKRRQWSLLWAQSDGKSPKPRKPFSIGSQRGAEE